MSLPTRILLHGVTGRMGGRRHLEGSLLKLREEGYALEISLAGRGLERLNTLASSLGTSLHHDVEEALQENAFDLFFDASNPLIRPRLLRAAISAGIGVYTEKPISLTFADAKTIFEESVEKGIYTAIVQDKLFTPGFRAAKRALEEDLLGEIYDIRCEFGYWVEPEFHLHEGNRPSWNYQRDKGGSLIPDIFSHWNYIIEIVDQIETVGALTATHIKERIDENGNRYEVTVPDLAHVTFRTKQGITGLISSSWIQRPPVPFKMRIFGAKAALIASPQECALLRNSSEENLISKFGIQGEDEFLSQWREVLEQYKSRKSVDFGFDSALRQAAFCDAIERAATRGENTKVAGY